MTALKILHVVPALGSIYGGPSQSVLELAKSLASCGVQIDIVTTNANGCNQLDVPLYEWVKEKEKSYRIKYFKCWYLSDYKVSLSMTTWLLRHITDYDLVNTHAIFSYSVLPAYWACQFHQVPYVIHPHGMLESWALAYKAWKKRPYYSLMEKPALQRASAIRVLSASEIRNTKVLGLETPLAFVPNGIHRQDFEILPDAELLYQKFPHTRNKTLILFLGRVDPKKGLDLLASAFAKVHSQFPQTHLIIAGPDNTGFLPTAQSYFAEAGCLDAVTFTGMLTGSIKYAALAAASIYIAPSYSEGFSMSVLEGMASGLPCVITTGCNFPEAAAAEAAHVVNIDADEIATALSQCLSNPQQAKVMGNRARQLILEKYTWDRIAVKLTEVYTAILNGKTLQRFS